MPSKIRQLPKIAMSSTVHARPSLDLQIIHPYAYVHHLDLSLQRRHLRSREFLLRVKDLPHHYFFRHIFPLFHTPRKERGCCWTDVPEIALLALANIGVHHGRCLAEA